MKHANIAIFVPHNGCKNQCTFCNQKEITGVASQPTKEDVFNTLTKAAKKLNGQGHKTQVAFFGGSFTAIEKNYMVSLLEVASKFVLNGVFNGIRISTRPDAIDKDILAILKKYGVNAIELGAQSMSDEVLMANKRGHKSSDVILSSALIKEAGFSLGLQMMTGLYKSNEKIDYYTAQEFIKLKPDTVRIYPTVVMKNTELEKLYFQKKYVPYSFDDTVKLCSLLLTLFEKENNVPVIRLGLHDSDNLRKNMLAGVFHPAFREICQSNIIFNETLQIIKEDNILKGCVTVSLNPVDVSKFVGQKRCNFKKLKAMGYDITLKQDKSLSSGKILISNRCG